MAEGMTETVKAFETASDMFDELVDKALSGKDVSVVVTWEDAPDEEGEAAQTPTVTIGKLTARQYVRQILCYVTDDTEFVETTGAHFEEAVANMWDSTIDYYDELDALGVELDELAVSSEASFLNEAKSRLQQQGTGEVGEGEVILTARHLARTALSEWADAVEQQGETG